MDRDAILALITDLAVLSDQRQWPKVAGLFTDPVAVDYTALTGGEATAVPPGELVGGWEQSFKEYTATQHIIGNQRIAVDGDKATAHAYFQATHCKTDGTLWILGGKYDYGLRHTGDGWRISSLTMTPLWSRDEQNSLEGAGYGQG